MAWNVAMTALAYHTILNISALIAFYCAMMLLGFLAAAFSEFHSNGFRPLRLPMPHDVEKWCKGLPVIFTPGVCLLIVSDLGLSDFTWKLEVFALILFAMAAFLEMVGLFTELLCWMFPKLQPNWRKRRVFQDLENFRCAHFGAIEQCDKIKKQSQLKDEQTRTTECHWADRIKQISLMQA